MYLFRRKICFIKKYESGEKRYQPCDNERDREFIVSFKIIFSPAIAAPSKKHEDEECDKHQKRKRSMKYRRRDMQRTIYMVRWVHVAHQARRHVTDVEYDLEDKNGPEEPPDELARLVRVVDHVQKADRYDRFGTESDNAIDRYTTEHVAQSITASI